MAEKSDANAYLYSSKNSCTYPNYKKNICIAVTSRPSSTTMSTILPRFSKACGFTTKHEQLHNCAVDALSR